MTDTSGSASSGDWTAHTTEGESAPSKLDALIAAADRTAIERAALTAVAAAAGQKINAAPWRPGQEIEIMGRGGLYDLERRRVQVAADAYYSQVLQTATLQVTGNYTEEISGNSVVSIGPRPVPEGQEPPADPPLATGNETLTVHGNAKVKFHERKTLLTGAVNRVWTGAITRMVGMEGVIVGGVYACVQAAPAMHVSVLNSGDVYGGAARAAVARAYIAGIGYRSVDVSAWAIGAYIRATTFTIEPEIGSPSKTTSTKNTALKAAKILVALCPFLEIGVGVVMLPVALIMLIAAAVRKKPPKPLGGPPRTRLQTVGVHNVAAATDMTQ